MNTNLPSFSRDDFITFISTFRSRARNKELESIDMMFYNVVRGLPADRGFTPITNKNKLANGSDASVTFKEVKRTLSFYLTKKPTWVQGRYGVQFTPEVQAALHVEVNK